MSHCRFNMFLLGDMILLSVGLGCKQMGKSRLCIYDSSAVQSMHYTFQQLPYSNKGEHVWTCEFVGYTCTQAQSTLMHAHSTCMCMHMHPHHKQTTSSLLGGGAFIHPCKVITKYNATHGHPLHFPPIPPSFSLPPAVQASMPMQVVNGFLVGIQIVHVTLSAQSWHMDILTAPQPLQKTFARYTDSDCDPLQLVCMAHAAQLLHVTTYVLIHGSHSEDKMDVAPLPKNFCKTIIWKCQWMTRNPCSWHIS